MVKSSFVRGLAKQRGQREKTRNDTLKERNGKNEKEKTFAERAQFTAGDNSPLTWRSFCGHVADQDQESLTPSPYYEQAPTDCSPNNSTWKPPSMPTLKLTHSPQTPSSTATLQTLRIWAPWRPHVPPSYSPSVPGYRCSLKPSQSCAYCPHPCYHS